MSRRAWSTHGFAHRLLLVAVATSLASLPGTVYGAEHGGTTGAGSVTGSDDRTAWSSQVREEIAASEYHVSWQGSTGLLGVEAAWHAPNRAQGIRSYFLDAGIRVTPREEEGEATWRWGLSLVGYGRDRRIAEVARPAISVAESRVEYARGDFVEWYVNDRRGVEQGFTLTAPPELAPAAERFVPGARRRNADGEAYLALALEGPLTARISADGQAIDFSPRAGGMTVLHYGHLEVVDAQGRTLPAWIEGFTEAGMRGIRLVFDDTDAVYPIVVDPLLTSPAWTAEADQAGARLGHSVANAGDVNNDGFDDVIVGAPYYDSGETDEGKVWLYLGSASGLEAEPAWTAEGDREGALLGWSVSTAGDVNDDDFDDVIVGAPGYDFDEADAEVEGRAWIYHGSEDGLEASAWSYEVVVTQSDDISSDDTQPRFGAAVAAAGDVDGDGFDDVIVGAPGVNRPTEDEGEAYVFFGSAGGLSSTPAWIAEGDSHRAHFGHVLAGGDVDRDGHADVAVAAPHHLSSRGVVRLYLGSGSDPWLPASPDWDREGTEFWAVYGGSLAMGDFDGNGFDDLVVGSPYYGGASTNPPQDRGLIHVFGGSPVGLGVNADWVAEGSEAIADGESPETYEFGWAVDAVDTNGDGYDDLVVGAQRYDNGGTNEGRTYVYESSSAGAGLPPGHSWAWKAESNQFEARFGWSVSSAGDVNGDGYEDIVVGAPYFTGGHEDEGLVSVYHGAPKVTGWKLASHLGFAPLEIGTSSWQVSSNGASLENNQTPEAATYGSIPESVLITTGRFIEKEPALDYPARHTGIADVDWGGDGQPDTTTYELQLNVPAWAGSLRFTTQYLTNEFHDSNPPDDGDAFDTDEATLRFRLNGWSIDEYPLNDPARWVVNSPVSHCLNVAGQQSVTLRFTVRDYDGTEDSGLLVSRTFFSQLPFPQDITLEHDGVDGDLDGVVDYFVNPQPSDISLTSGTYTYTENLLTIPGISMPFNLALVYNSQADRTGIVGRKWTHTYLGYTEQIWKDEDDPKDGVPETLDSVMIRHGAGTMEYFEPDAAVGFKPKFPGTRSRLSEVKSGTCTDGTGTSGSCDYYVLETASRLTYTVREKGDKDKIRLLRSVVDRFGNKVTFHYLKYGSDDVKRVSHVVDTRGETICFRYSEDRLTAVNYEPGRTDCNEAASWGVGLHYDPATNDLASVTDLGGFTKSFTYDAAGNLMAVNDEDGMAVVANSYEQFQMIDFLQVGDRVFSRRGAGDSDPFDPEAGLLYEYDADSLRQIDRLGHEDVRLYDVKGRLARRISPSGVQFDFTYDHDGNTIETRRKLLSDEWPEPVSALEFDGAGDLLSRADLPWACIGGPSAGSVCSSDAGCPGSTCGVRQSMTYDLRRNRLTTADHDGRTTTYAYDANSSLISATDPLGNSIAHTYTTDGRPASTIDVRGQTYTCEYDFPISQPSRVYNPIDADRDGVLDHVVNTYDDLGRRTATTDPNGNTTTFEYDDAGRLLAEIDPFGKRTEYSYDSSGRPILIRESNGATTSSAYSPTGRLLRTTDPLGRTTSYEYDDQDRLVSVIDPLGRVLRYAYDPAGRTRRVMACDATRAICIGADAEYDEVGNLARLIDPRGRATVYEYDRLGRVVRETDAHGASIRYAHGVGGPVAQTNARGQTINYEYDAAGRTTRIDLASGSITHTLDGSGNPLSTDSDRFASVTRVYDELDRLVEQTDEFGNTIRYAYDPVGNLRSVTYADGSIVVYSYDALNRLVRLEDWFDPANPPPVPLDAVACEGSAGFCRLATYAYDAVGNPIAANLPDGSTVTSSYDLAQQLIGLVVQNGLAGTIFSGGYLLDDAGQRVKAAVVVPVEPPTVETTHDLTHNELNQVIARGSDSFSYDADGNLTSGVIGGVQLSLAHDELNQLERVNADTFRYDVDGLRVESNRASGIRRYVHDSAGQLLEERDENGVLLTRYVYGLGLVSRESLGGQEYRVYHFDSRGSTVALTDAAGTITDRYAYDPYGGVLAHTDGGKTACDQSTDCTPNPFTYGGRDGVFDDDNGLYYMRARYYAPELMRFIERDGAPVGLSDPRSLNRYAYVQGNPIQLIDPDGNWFGLDDAVAAIGGALVGVVLQAVECGISSGGSFEGEGIGCGWEDFAGAAAGGAAGGMVLLYTGNPVAAGMAAGAVDSLATSGLKAIPGGEDISWQEAAVDLGVQVGFGALGGGGKALKAGKAGKSQAKTLRNLSRHQSKLYRKTGRMNRHLRSALIDNVKPGLGEVLFDAGVEQLKGLASSHLNSLFGGGGDGDGGVGRGGAAVGSVWNQQPSPHADAWEAAATSGCIAYAWR